jgi:adenosylcobinamide-GDP ribazoletransferase
LNAFETALAFLTIFRVRGRAPATVEEVGKSAWAFPLVGAAIGLVLVVVWQILSGFFPVHVLAVLVLALWIVLTGGLHLDGWADCWDALAASAPPEKRREILKDSRLGTFGAVGLILLLAAKAGAMARPDLPILILFLAPVVGRGAMVIVVQGTVHRGHGMAASFVSGLDSRTVGWVWGLTIVAAVAAGWRGIFAAALAIAAAFGFRRLAESRLQMVNGDVLGGACELSEAVVLVVACIGA